MIVRASDFAGVLGAAGWVCPAGATDATGPADARKLFEGAAGTSAVIRADVATGARGLTIEQHAERVLGLLCGEARR